jgi:3-oxoacyl-[acyl-carrier-protein] synthase II
MSDRVAVTGIGAISPFGPGVELLEQGLLECRGCLAPLQRFEVGFRPAVGEIAGEVPLEERSGFRASRTDRMAVMAAREATADAPDLQAAGAVIATTVAGLSDIEPEIATDPASYYRRGGFADATAYPNSHVSDAVAAYLGLEGPSFAVSVACASGAMSIALAAQMVLDGDTPMMLAGGSDALCAFTVSGFHSLQALDPEPCRPFDKGRQGLNLGEGAAVVVLEPLARARARGAKVWAVLDGWGMTNDAYHLTAPHEEGRGVAECVQAAMRMAGVSPDAIGYVNAHGTATPMNDIAESKGYECAFRARRRPIPVSSTKSYFGHCLGAAGALEAVITILSLRGGVLFPTLRLNDPIDSAAIDWVRGGVRREPLTHAMSVSAGFGGSNTALVFSRGD